MFGRAIAERAFQELTALRTKGPVSPELWIETVERVANETLSPTEKPNPMSRADRNLLFEAVAEACQYPLAEITKSKAKEITTALGEIRTKVPDLTPDEIRRRSAKYREKHPTWEFTPTALSKWWADLSAPRDKVDVYQEPTGDWKSVLIRIAGDEYRDATWVQIRSQFGRRIWQSLS